MIKKLLSQCIEDSFVFLFAFIHKSAIIVLFQQEQQFTNSLISYDFMREIEVALPSRKDFSGAVDSTFRVLGPPNTQFDLLLVEVNELVSNETQENFSLLFRAPADAPPVQSLYRLEHKTLGEFDLFIVPVKKDDSGLYLEAVFNQFKEPQIA